MADKKEIKFSIPKEKAIKIAKKAATSKFAMMEDNGAVFKVGAPMMKATVEVGDGVIYVSGKGAAGPIANTIYGLIEDAIEEAQNSNSSPAQQAAPQMNVEDQIKIVEAIKGFKELLDAGIITQEEFESKKKELLEANSQPKSNVQQEVFPKVDDDSQTPVEQAQNPINEDTPASNIKEETNQKQKRMRIIDLVALVFLGVTIIMAIVVLILMISLPFCEVEFYDHNKEVFIDYIAVNGTTAIFGGTEMGYSFKPSLLTLISFVVILCGILLGIGSFALRFTKKQKVAGVLNIIPVIIFIVSAILILTSEEHPIFPSEPYLSECDSWRHPSVAVEWIMILSTAVFGILPIFPPLFKKDQNN